MSTLRASVCKKLGLSATASQTDVYRAALKKIALGHEVASLTGRTVKNDYEFRDASFGHRFLPGEKFRVVGNSQDQVTLEHVKTGTRVRVSMIFFEDSMSPA